MTPFIPSPLEAHLITHHGVQPELVARNRERLEYEVINLQSHELLHVSWQDFMDHTH